MAVNDDMICRLGILEICVNLKGTGEDEECVKRVMVDSYHSNPESNVQYLEASSFKHCIDDYNMMPIIQPIVHNIEME